MAVSHFMRYLRHIDRHYPLPITHYLITMTEKKQTTLFPPRTLPELKEQITLLTTEIQELYCNHGQSIAIGWSGGKDSTTVLQLVWNAILELPIEKRTKKIHVISNDTLVENPIVSHWVRQSMEIMNQTAKKQQMPIETHLTHPAIKDTFWVCLIGKGYPAPRNKFRWCTDRMKIKPADALISNIIRENGEVILALGTRKAESISRKIAMEKREKWRVADRLNSNATRPNSLCYTPIEDWRTDEVWLYLMQWQNPWGVDNQDLFTMYRGATADNECPLVIDTSTASCGDSRFGCWVCTMVSKDKSMEAMIQNDEEKEWLQPLLDIRDELDIQNDHDKRDFRRIYGKIELFERNVDGNTTIAPIPGPYTKYWREYWLTQVLKAQTEVRKLAPEGFENLTLISMEELSEIRRIWLEEKHEFDDSLPRIYQEVTGEVFLDSRIEATDNLLGVDEWNLLQEICEDDPMHLELMTRLLDTERQFFTKVRRVGIFQAIEKCFDTSSRSKEEAIANAHYIREIKNAVKDGDVKTLQQKLTWEQIKFKK